MFVLMFVLLALALLSPWYVKRLVRYLEEKDQDLLWPPWYVKLLGFLFGNAFLAIPLVAGAMWERAWAPQLLKYESGAAGMMIMIAWCVIAFQFVWHLSRERLKNESKN